MSKSLVIIALLSIALPATSDTLSNRRAKDVQVYRFGDTLIRQTYDSRRNPGSPEMKLQVYVKGQLKLHLNDALFEQFFPSPDGEVIVGLSNGGWPGSAAIAFDTRGRILLLSDHQSASFDYCFMTSTFGREWYDAKDPQVRFPDGPGVLGLNGITIKSCKGNTIGLVESVNKAADNYYQGIPEFLKPRFESH